MKHFSIGEIARLDSEWEYKGPDYNKARIRVSFGKRTADIFNELLWDDTGLSVPLSSGFTPLKLRQLITITSKLTPGDNYDFEAKIYEGNFPSQII